MNIFFGANAPFVGGPQNFMSRQVDDQLIRNDLLQLLLTSPGERVMRPAFGAGIKDFLFDQGDETTIERVRVAITNAIQKFENRVTIDSLQIDPNVDDNVLRISVFGSINLEKLSSATILEAESTSNLLIELNIPVGDARSISQPVAIPGRLEERRT